MTVTEQMAFAEIAGAIPDASIFAVSTELASTRERDMFNRVRVTVSDEDTGEELCSGSGYIAAAGPAERGAGKETIIARVHKIKLG